MDRRKAFTLIELVITVSLIAIITGIYFIAANPGGQLASSRNTKRQSDLEAIMLAVRQNIADQGNEQFSCSTGPIPTSTTRMTTANGGYNIAPCIIIANGAYGLYSMPFDPNASSAHYTSLADYDTGYSIAANSSTGQITLSAPYAELKKTISVSE
jgi:prepilin-type N-terminal cleavage/methylation domain-containing protein